MATDDEKEELPKFPENILNNPDEWEDGDISDIFDALGQYQDAVEEHNEILKEKQASAENKPLWLNRFNMAPDGALDSVEQVQQEIVSIQEQLDSFEPQVKQEEPTEAVVSEEPIAEPLIQTQIKVEQYAPPEVNVIHPEAIEAETFVPPEPLVISEATTEEISDVVESNVEIFEEETNRETETVVAPQDAEASQEPLPETVPVEEIQEEIFQDFPQETTKPEPIVLETPQEEPAEETISVQPIVLEEPQEPSEIEIEDTYVPETNAEISVQLAEEPVVPEEIPQEVAIPEEIPGVPPEQPLTVPPIETIEVEPQVASVETPVEVEPVDLGEYVLLEDVRASFQKIVGMLKETLANQAPATTSEEAYELGRKFGRAVIFNEKS
jgi:hypothetical protein